MERLKKKAATQAAQTAKKASDELAIKSKLPSDIEQGLAQLEKEKMR